MNAHNFTDRVRKVMQVAREEAQRLRNEHVGTEHILLGLLLEGDGVAAAVLANLDVDLEKVRASIEDTMRGSAGAGAPGPELPYTSRAKKVLELAMSEARELNHDYVGTEHLLLGLLREEQGLAARALRDEGLTIEAARAETVRLLGAEEPPRGRRLREDQPAPSHAAPAHPYALSWPAFFVRVMGGVVFLVEGMRALSTAGWQDRDWSVSDLFHAVAIAAGFLLILGWKRRAASVALGFLLLAVAATQVYGAAVFEDVGSPLLRLVFLLPGLALDPAADSRSVDGWLARSGIRG